MIEDLEAGLNGSPIDASITDDVALAEVENSDEAIIYKLRLAMKQKRILNKNERMNHIKRQWALILKILTQLKRKTKYIQKYRVQSTKL